MPSNRYYQSNQKDYSGLAVHFVRDTRAGNRPMSVNGLIQEGDPLYDQRYTSAFDKLVNILNTRTVFASPMPYVQEHAQSCLLHRMCLEWFGRAV